MTIMIEWFNGWKYNDVEYYFGLICLVVSIEF